MICPIYECGLRRAEVEDRRLCDDAVAAGSSALLLVVDVDLLGLSDDTVGAAASALLLVLGDRGGGFLGGGEESDEGVHCGWVGGG